MNVDKIGSYDVAPVLESGQVVKPHGPILVPGLEEDNRVWGIYLQEVVDADHPDHGRVHIVHQGEVKAAISGLMPAVKDQPVLVGTDGKLYGGAHVEFIENDDSPLIPLEPSIPTVPNTKPVVKVTGSNSVTIGDVFTVTATITSQYGYNYSWAINGAELVKEEIINDQHIATVKAITVGNAVVSFKATDKKHGMETTESLVVAVTEEVIVPVAPEMHLHAPVEALTDEPYVVVVHVKCDQEFLVQPPVVTNGVATPIAAEVFNDNEEGVEAFSYSVLPTSGGDVVFSISATNKVDPSKITTIEATTVAKEVVEPVAPVVSIVDITDKEVGDEFDVEIHIVAQNADLDIACVATNAFSGVVNKFAEGIYKVRVLCNKAAEVELEVEVVDKVNGEMGSAMSKFNVTNPAPKDYDSMALNFESKRYVTFPTFNAENCTVEYSMLFARDTAHHHLFALNSESAAGKPFFCMNKGSRIIELNVTSALQLEDAYVDNTEFKLTIVKTGNTFTASTSNGIEGTTELTGDYVWAINSLGMGATGVTGFESHFAGQIYKIKMTDNDTNIVREYVLTRGADSDPISLTIPDVHGGAPATVGGDVSNLNSVYAANISKLSAVVLNRMMKVDRTANIVQAVKARTADGDKAIKLTSAEGVELKPATNLVFVTDGMTPMVRIADDHDCC